MRKVCLINNFNYGQYLEACLDSAVDQSSRFDLICIVDDGSTDGSREIIKRYSDQHAELKAIFKKNGGQLSCFNTAREIIRDDDLVFLLDSDDMYPRDYVEKFLEMNFSSATDFYFCNPKVFESPEGAPVTAVVQAGPEVEIPGSSNLTRINLSWVGEQTSSLVVTGKLFRDIFPYPFESDWITRADDVLVFASSLAGYSKIFVPSLCIGYRVHGKNRYYGKPESKSELKERKRVLLNLFHWFIKKYSLPRIPSLSLAIDEYKKSRKYFDMTGKTRVWKVCVKYFLRLPTYIYEMRKINDLSP